MERFLRLLFVALLVAPTAPGCVNGGRTTVSRTPDVQTFDLDLDRFASRLRVPGMAVGVALRDSLIHFRGMGYADLEKRTPVTPSTIFWIASVTKTFTAVALKKPMVDGTQPMDYVALQRSGDTQDARARATYLKSAFVPRFPEGLITTMVEGLVPHPARTTIGYVQQSGGQIGRVANDATAFSHRDSAGNLLGIVDWAQGSDPSEHIAYIKSYWAAVEQFTQGFYTNDMTEDTTSAAINANYRGNYRRLVEIKKKYDPTNLFRLNANVKPTA